MRQGLARSSGVQGRLSRGSEVGQLGARLCRLVLDALGGGAAGELVVGSLGIYKQSKSVITSGTRHGTVSCVWLLLLGLSVACLLSGRGAGRAEAGLKHWKATSQPTRTF